MYRPSIYCIISIQARDYSINWTPSALVFRVGKICRPPIQPQLVSLNSDISCVILVSGLGLVQSIQVFRRAVTTTESATICTITVVQIFTVSHAISHSCTFPKHCHSNRQYTHNHFLWKHAHHFILILYWSPTSWKFLFMSDGNC